ncbi:xanthine dehydrogenase small subunit [Geodermatophilus dictyosporus]|uniref:Xanthine dehydrogenase small subunit n=1 Tax=Geodermatophilus dictyosporus TaxID=1523247 RepID=A0A1I5J816_9ACTN|nr:FAD binding domain-containing protein [Geodermatophilus dictyosporus]SFO69004.1 xanthine dehydrogenase small subunit [Geodermatophilus dictyosporus]
MQSPAVTVNGQVVPLDGVAPHTTALDWLRGRGLLGCKEGCAEGECGACSVLVARPGVAAPTQWTALNACLLPIAALDGQELVTAEGLGTPAALHPVQREIAVRGGSQCGYCTPGFVCSMAAEYYRPDRAAAGPSTGRPGAAAEPDGHLHGPNGFDLHALSGNLCRCTGYRPLRDAAFALGEPPAEDPFAARRDAPPPPVAATRVVGGGAEFVRPADLPGALDLLAGRPGALVLAGSTDWGVDVNLRAARAALVVAVDRLPELRTLDVGPESVEIGAALTLTEVETLLAGRVPLLDELFPQFASRLIRNGATIGGNLGTGSPIGDTAPALLALDASVVLASPEGEREVPLADYHTGYRQSVRRPGELIRAVRIPLPQPRVVAFHKIAKRRFDDISSVAVGFGLDVEDGVVRRARIGLGGVAATPLRARATEAALVGRPWTEEMVRSAARVMAGEGTPLDDHRASAAYRSAMLGQALLRLHTQHRTPQEVGA